MWATFGPQQSGSSALRPFGSASVDGFDFDFEAGVNNVAPFANQLRSLMNASGRKFYLSAAPQCPYPDYADNQMLDGAVSFDFVSSFSLKGVLNCRLTQDRSTSSSTITTVVANPTFQAQQRRTISTSTHGTTGRRRSA